MGEPQGGVNTLHACYRVLEIGVSCTNFQMKCPKAYSIHTSIWPLCASEVKVFCKGEHLHSPVSVISSFLSSKLKPTPLRSNSSYSLHSEEQISLCWRTAKPRRARDCFACRTIMSPVCTRFSFRKLLCPFSNTEINTTDVRTAEPPATQEEIQQALLRIGQDRGLGTRVTWRHYETHNSILTIWQHCAVCNQCCILYLCTSVSCRIQGRKHTLEVIQRCNVKISKSSTFKATSKFPRSMHSCGFFPPPSHSCLILEPTVSFLEPVPAWETIRDP